MRFNHRHHPAILEARTRFERGDFGRPIAARCRYAFAASRLRERVRADPARAAGGQFAEQGAHAIDLFRWFLGDLADVSCMTSIVIFASSCSRTTAWRCSAPLTAALATLHSSLTHWRTCSRSS